MAEVHLAYTVTEGVNDSVSICAVVSRPASGDCPITFECTMNLSVGGGKYPIAIFLAQYFHVFTYSQISTLWYFGHVSASNVLMCQ